MSDLQQPNENISMKSNQLICLRCRQDFPHIVVEEVEGGIMQLRVGNMLMTRVEGACVHCGWKFSHHLRDQDVEEMAKHYGEILKNNKQIKPD